MDCKNRRTAARLARAIWCLGNGIWAVLPLATQWDLESDFLEITAARGCHRHDEPPSSSCRWQCDSRPPTRGGCKKRELALDSLLSEIEQVQQREAPERSKGGFSIKYSLALLRQRLTHQVLAHGRRTTRNGCV